MVSERAVLSYKHEVVVHQAHGPERVVLSSKHELRGLSLEHMALRGLSLHVYKSTWPDSEEVILLCIQ